MFCLSQPSILPWRRVLFVCALVVFCGVALAHAWWVARWQLPASWVKRDMLIEGEVIGLPEKNALGTRFLFRTAKMDHKRKQIRLRLSWFAKPVPVVAVGDSWRFVVRLKPPHALQNFGRASSMSLFKVNAIRATGYIRQTQKTVRLAQRACCTMTRLRARVFSTIQKNVRSADLAGLMAALTLGTRQGLSSAQWRVFTRTGTSHLIAISGLHVGLVAGIAYWIFFTVWRYGLLGLRWVSAPSVGALGAMMSALCYSAFAGWSLPTQRALIMLVAVFWEKCGGWTVGLTRRLMIAFFIIICMTPYAVMRASFWLSFLAVMMLGFALGGRTGHQPVVRSALKVQMVMSLALLPVSLYFFQGVSSVMWFANLIAIPWVSFLVLPLCLLGALVSLVAPFAAKWVWLLCAGVLSPLWSLLQWFAVRGFAYWSHGWMPFWMMVLAELGLLQALAPRGWPTRYLSVLWLLPVVFARPEAPQFGAVWLTVLDVGQGLASVVQTQHHTLVYDAGPRYASGFDAGTAVVLPYLLQQRRQSMDRLIISHSDNDHAGGSLALHQAFPNALVLTSQPGDLPALSAQNCYRGQAWEWDGVSFRVVYPPKAVSATRNDRSCVVIIQAGSHRILLPGDIEETAEKWLLTHQRDLRASVMVVPHHGSASSSIKPFLLSVRPQYAIFSTGFYNRFGFPRRSVLSRYAEFGVKTFNTATQGAIQIRLFAGGRVRCLTAQAGIVEAACRGVENNR